MRAFKSTLEDIEEKRSIHSFHSLHSLRHSKSQCSRPLCDEQLGRGRQNGTYAGLAVASSGRSRSRSLETISSSGGGGGGGTQQHVQPAAKAAVGGGTVLPAGITVPVVVIQGASPSPSRTFSDPELNESLI